MIPGVHDNPEHVGSIVRSDAFREAALRTEIRRAYAVIGVVGLVLALVISRGTMRDLDIRIVTAGAAGIGSLVVLQYCALAFARWARRRERSIPVWFIVATVVIESLIPTGMMLAQILPGSLAPYASLNSPPVLAYGLMLCLTTLRLRPWLCLLAGATAAAGYGGLVVFVSSGLGIMVPTTGLPLAAYISSTILILVSGVAAAWVAAEIRGHMEAALGEAETRRQMARLEQDLAVARSIQQALLPRTAPEIPGFEIAGWNRPADLTGGDYYDWQAMPDGNWIVTLADVSGHGIGPAMVTATCRAYMRASSGTHRDLGELISRINRLLADDLPDGRFITMATVVIEPGRGPVALLSAGHGPIAIYVGARGVVEDILPRDLPLAVMPDTEFGPAQRIEMAPGDILALVTDGFVEWARHDESGRREEFGLPRLRESLHRHAGLSASEMIGAITADVAAFAGEVRQQDDLTMVIVRRTG